MSYHTGYGGRQKREGDNHRNYRQHTIGYRKLQDIASKPKVEAVVECSKEPFFDLLKKDDLGRDWIDLALQAIETALGVDDSMSSFRDQLKTELLIKKLQFLKEVCKDRLDDEIVESSKPRTELLAALKRYLNIYDHLQVNNPSARANLSPCLKILRGSLVSKSTGYENILADYNKAIEQVDRYKILEMEQKGEGGLQQERGGRVCVGERPLDDFRNITVHPTLNDIISKTKVRLRKNKAEGEFEDADDYLDTQFRLLREDFVSTIREGIRELKKSRGFNRPGRTRAGDCKIYKDFTIEGEELTHNGRLCIVRLPQHSAFRNAQWLQSKKLIYGSLICLSGNDFSDGSILFATVAERDNAPNFKDKNNRFPYAGRNGGKHYQGKRSQDGKEIRIKFLPESQVEYESLTNKTGPFMVLESSAFYEAYHHVLRGLQTFTTGSLPFQDYIVRCQQDIRLPSYVSDIIKYQLPYGKIYHTSRRHTSPGHTSPLPVNDFTFWPLADDLQFNHSQYEAYKAALTQEFAVIQGPPGTGKTYVGLRIVQTLLTNLFKAPYGRYTKDDQPMELGFLRQLARPVNTPILVVCYTNHALDQFLEGILKFCTFHDVIRVGSRSKSESLHRCNLNVRKREIDRWKCEIGFITAQKYHKREAYEECAQNCKQLQNKMLVYKLNELLVPEDYMLYSSKGYRRGQNDQLSDPFHHHFVRRWLQTDYWNGNYWLEQFQKDQYKEKLKPKKNNGKSGKSTSQKVQVQRFQTTVTSNQSDQADEEIDDEMDEEDEMEDLRLIDGIDSSATDENLLVEIPLMKIELVDENAMTEAEVDSLKVKCRTTSFCLYDLALEQRWRLYRYWYKCYYDREHKELQEHIKDYELLIKKDYDIKSQSDIEVLKDAKVIGMTTTGAARMQSILQQVGPEIVVVEEAAEVLEAHIITALSKHCKHLILIGDHKQLKPNPTVYDLAQKYHLDLSLFERMVNNGLPVKTLNIQHRMRPEISKFMRHIYDRLDDHPSVLERAPIRGMSKSVFFFSHQNPEQRDEGLMSKSNTFEAEMVVELARYLIKQNYKPSEITIITMYKGQELLIKSKARSAEFREMKITAVDNFQGEENDIVILSLVRSNKEEKLGFVGIENRVCVSLSRAKYGMYVFGDFDMICKKSDIWRKMVDDAKSNGEFGTELNLSCVQHAEAALVKEPEDFFQKAPKGGCRQICGQGLPNCDHKCKEKCHYQDIEHRTYECQEACQRKCKAGLHPCKKLCYKRCDPCEEVVTKKLMCSHEKTAKCWELTEPISAKCLAKCIFKLNCGHICQEICSAPHTEECQIKVEMGCSVCGEISMVNCVTNKHPDRFWCLTPCAEILTCGHKCSGNCSLCQKVGHQRCEERCGVTLVCGHPCPGKCADCQRDGHTNCEEKCCETLVCRHPCSGRCADCQRDGHKECEERCGVTLECGHPCSGKCADCQTDGHKKCEERCSVTLECGHPCSGKCADCNVDNHPPCSEICETFLPCGHQWKGPCSDCQSTKVHVTCKSPCKKILACGHKCGGKCGECEKEGCLRCQENCTLRCSHGRVCTARCYQPCKYPCRTVCDWGCDKCGMCRLPCEVPCRHRQCECRCTKRCTCVQCKKSYTCQGLRNEPCPEMCPNCDRSHIAKAITTLPNFQINKRWTRWLKLVDCKHILPMRYMDEWVEASKEDAIICPYPDCCKRVLNMGRYVNVTRKIKHDKFREERDKLSSHPRKRKNPAASTSEWIHYSSQHDSTETHGGVQNSWEQALQARSVARRLRKRTHSESDDGTAKRRRESQNKHGNESRQFD